MPRPKILIADDDREIIDLIELYLALEPFEIIKAHDGQDALKKLRLYEISLLVLDVMMPGINGFEVCKKLRESSNIPVIIISAKDTPPDRIMGLSLGADDYLIKPFHPMELVARIKAQMRRFTELNPGFARDEIIVKDLVINLSDHMVTRNSEPIQLTPKEFDILCLLAKSPNRVFNSEMIFSLVWGEQAFNQENTVMVHIRKLREKLGDNSKKPRYIHTVWGVGYKIEN